MKRRYQIEQQRAVQQFRRHATEQNPNIQMVLPLAEIVSLLQQGVGNLLRHYDRMRKKDDDHYPVVRLKVSGYNHRDERVGWVHTPVFAVVGNASKASAAIPDTSPSGDLDDAIPF